MKASALCRGFVVYTRKMAWNLALPRMKIHSTLVKAKFTHCFWCAEIHCKPQ